VPWVSQKTIPATRKYCTHGCTGTVSEKPTRGIPVTNPMDPIRWKLPLRPSHLDAFLCIAHRTGRYDDLFFAALLSCCFYACHRSSELVWKNQKDLQDWWKVIKRASLHFSDGCVGYHLPYHKADHFYHRTEVLFTHWILWLFFRSTLHAMMQFTVEKLLCSFTRTVLSNSGLGWQQIFALLDHQFGGHSARAGGTTFYTSLGVTEDIIQALGHWSSRAWKDYIHDNPTTGRYQTLLLTYPVW
jgi:hypothetical protein